MENNQNIADTPKYKGVRKRKWGKWVSEIRLPNSRDRIWLGSYDSPEKAARAFDAAQFCLRGPNANFNFPHNPPHIPGARSMSPDQIRAAAARYANVSAGDDVHVEESASSVSDCGTTSSTVQIECGGGTVGLESSFYEQLSLCSNAFESGNYMSDFGLFPDFGDFNSTNYFSPEMDNNNNNNNNAHTDNINFDYYDSNNNNEDHYDSSIYQDSYLWNF